MVARDVHDERLPGGGGRLDAIGAADVVFANTGERRRQPIGIAPCTGRECVGGKGDNFFALICTQNSCY